MTFTQLGLYQIANVVARAVGQISSVISSRVVFPVYAKIGRETTPDLIRRVYKIRLATMALLLPPSWVLTCFGDFPVRWMWDVRYHGAGWMVRILSAGGVFLSFSAGPLYLARGEPWQGVIFGLFHASIMVPAMVVGAKMAGPSGLVVAVGFSQIADYIFEAYLQHRYKVWLPWLDVLGLGLSAVMIAAGLLLRRRLGIPE
jgi:O-antigen/teichoic acid export membrane protein